VALTGACEAEDAARIRVGLLEALGYDGGEGFVEPATACKREAESESSEARLRAGPESSVCGAGFGGLGIHCQTADASPAEIQT